MHGIAFYQEKDFLKDFNRGIKGRVLNQMTKYVLE